MSGHEARINDALKSLGEEYRLGMVALEEYRSRRRMLLESWGERDATTAPGSNAMRGIATTSTNPAPASRLRSAAPSPTSVADAPAAEKRNPAFLIAAITAALVAVAGTWYVMSHRAAAPATHSMRSAAPAAAPLGEAAVAIKQSADEFLARNSWDPAPIDAFLVQWTALTPEDRALALEEPSLRTLRYELEQNLTAETQLVAPDAPAEQRVRLDALTRFKQQLGGS